MAELTKEELKTQLADAVASLETVETELATVKAENLAKGAIIAALEAELATSQSTAIGAPKTASLGGKKYRVTIPAIRHKGNIVTAEDILGNEELLAELVALVSGAIEEVTDEE